MPDVRDAAPPEEVRQASVADGGSRPEDVSPPVLTSNGGVLVGWGDTVTNREPLHDQSFGCPVVAASIEQSLGLFLVETAREPHERGERHIHFARLDLLPVPCVKIGSVRRLFERQSSLFSASSHVGRELLAKSSLGGAETRGHQPTLRMGCR